MTWVLMAKDEDERFSKKMLKYIWDLFETWFVLYNNAHALFVLYNQKHAFYHWMVVYWIREGFGGGNFGTEKRFLNAVRPPATVPPPRGGKGGRYGRGRGVQ